MAKDESIRERLKGVETELRGFRELVEQREKTALELHVDTIRRLDRLNDKRDELANTISAAITAHAQACPGSQQRIGLSFREDWKLITLLITLSGTLAGALVLVLNMLGPLIRGA